MTFEAKYLGSNGWLIKFDKTNLIIDPWLTGNLVFPPGEWFFKGSLNNEILIDENINIILLTQGLPDHCHVPSLKRFKKNIDVILFIFKLIVFFSLIKKIKLPNKISQALEKGK